MESLGLRTLTLTFKDLEPKDVIPNGDGGAAGGEGGGGGGSSLNSRKT